MKATLLLTTSCNLRCDYCYISRQNHSMTSDTLVRAVDFAFSKVQPGDRLDIGLFGGEPLLNWPRVREAVALVEERMGANNNDVRVSLVSNGTLLNNEILEYLSDHNIILQVSCDGIPHVHDKHRLYPDGRASSATVEAKLLAALKSGTVVIVNMVYGPDTYRHLSDSIQYLASLGLKQLIQNPDYSAVWKPEDISGLEEEFDRIADIYVAFYRKKSPLFISLIDEKIAVILRGGYAAKERCNMGYGEFAFSPQGFIFPCERLVGNGDQNRHCIGHLDQPHTLSRRHCKANGNGCRILECQVCSLADYCMNWCGCSNFMASGDYFSPSPFLCASERFSIKAAYKVLKKMEDSNPLMFINHYAGLPMANSSIQGG